MAGFTKENLARFGNQSWQATIEITSSEKITERDTQALNHFYPDLGPAEAFCLSRDPHQKKIDAVWCLPWQEGLGKLGV